MSVEFRPSALSAFKSIDFGNADAIVNIDSNKKLTQNGKLGFFLWRPFRSSETQAKNNEARTALLKSLGQAFNLEGVSQSNGKTVFSKDFMDQLEKILGKEFKRGDFGVGDDGTVTSGKPLTERRIKAIIANAEKYASADSVSGAAPVKTHSITGGLRKDDVYAPLLDKVATINKEIKNAPEHVVNFFARVEKTIDFLYNELDVEQDPEKDADTDPSALRIKTEFKINKDFGLVRDGEPTQFEYYDYNEGKFKDLKSTYDYQNEILFKRVGGEFFHLERANFNLETSESIEPLKKYIINTAMTFVKQSINTYFACKESGKMEEFYSHLRAPGACLEQQGLNMIEFQGKTLHPDDVMSLDDARMLSNAAEGKPIDLPKNAVDQFMEVFIDLEDEPFFNENWNKDLADRVKEELVGKQCTMQDFDAPHELGKKVPELIGKNNMPVVKTLTAEMVDDIGKKVLREWFRK